MLNWLDRLAFILLNILRCAYQHLTKPNTTINTNLLCIPQNERGKIYDPMTTGFEPPRTLQIPRISREIPYPRGYCISGQDFSASRLRKSYILPSIDSKLLGQQSVQAEDKHERWLLLQRQPWAPQLELQRRP